MKNEMILDGYEVENLSFDEQTQTEGGWFGPSGVGFRVWFTFGWDKYSVTREMA